MEKFKNNTNNRVWTGLVIMMVGIVFFLDNMGINIPNWVISWNTFLIVIGLLVGYKRNFEGGGWLIMVLIGGYFTMESIFGLDLSKYYMAIGFIVLGLYLILKPKRTSRRLERCKKKYARFQEMNIPPVDGGDPTDETTPETADKQKLNIDENDILQSINVFGGSQQYVYSKQFKGGDVIAIFGGGDVNFTQADFEGTIVLDVVAIFGGVKLVLPPSWDVKSEVTAIFGGIEDKRATLQVTDGPRKVVKIKGVALFGGVEIKNF